MTLMLALLARHLVIISISSEPHAKRYQNWETMLIIFAPTVSDKLTTMPIIT